MTPRGGAKSASLEAVVTKWTTTAWTLWRVERPKVVNATVVFAEA